MDMYQIGENLLSSLTGDEVRLGQGGCPVVLVGHCLGGLVLEELCLTAAWVVGRKDPDKLGVQRTQKFLSSLKGMFYYGTPHNGSLLPSLLDRDRLPDEEASALLKEIEILKETSARRISEFNDLKSNEKYKWVTSGVGESHETYVECLEKKLHVVPEASTRPYMDDYFSAQADHYDICRPTGMKDSTLLFLGRFLRKIQEDGLLRAGEADAESSREYFIDLQSRASRVRSFLDQSDTVFIVGPSGIGKTAVAQRVYHGIGGNFDVKCFVSIDNIDTQSDVKEHVLRKIQKDLEGAYGGSILLVLDSVKSKGQLDALREALRKIFMLKHISSRLIVTTTKSNFGPPSNTYQVPYLSKRESQQLFGHYAFKGGDQPVHLKEVIQRVIDECDNFPLALKIFGSYVYSRSEDLHDLQLWQDLLDRQGKAQEVDKSDPDLKIWAKLRPSYDALGSPEQEVFLDIATTFHGFPLPLVKHIWKGCRESPDSAWRNLERLSLVNVDLDGNIQMQGQLRKLGQSIACPWKDSVPEIGKWKRIPDSTTAKKLIADHQGGFETRSLKLQIVEGECLSLGDKYPHLQYLILEGGRTSPGRLELPKSLVYLRWTNGLFDVCPDFTGLKNLVALELPDCKFMKFLSPGIADATNLTWLELEGCLSLKELPSGICKSVEHVGLRMTGLEKLPSEIVTGITCLHANQIVSDCGESDVNRQRLEDYKNSSGAGDQPISSSVSPTQTTPKVKELTTSVCLGCGGVGEEKIIAGEHEKLYQCTACGAVYYHNQLDPQELGGPDGYGSELNCVPRIQVSRLSKLSRLISLDISHITSICELPESIGDLKCLKRLFLKNTMVTSLPKSIGLLQNLEVLNCGSSRLLSLPESLGELTSLRSLSFRNTLVTSLPESIGRLQHLEVLNCGSNRLRSLPESLGRLLNLRRLFLDNTMVPSLPESIGGLQCLRQLDLDHTHVTSLPKSIGDLVHLELLSSNFTPLEILPDSIGNLRHLSYLGLEGTQLKTLPSTMGDLFKLEDLRVSSTRWREWPESLGKLSNLRRLEVGIGPFWETSASSLETGEVGGRREDSILAPTDRPGELKSRTLVSQLSAFQAVRSLTLNGRGFREHLLTPLFHALGQLPSLEYLELREFNLVEIIPFEVKTLQNLRILSMKGCDRLLELPESLVELRKLDTVYLSGIPRLCRLPECLSACPALRRLHITDCPSLKSMPGSVSQVSCRKRGYSTVDGNRWTPADSANPAAAVRPIQLEWIYTDSWELVQCFLHCCGRHSSELIWYGVECMRMEKARKNTAGPYMLDTKRARGLFKEIYLHPCGRKGGLNEAFRRPTCDSFSDHCGLHQALYLTCSKNSTFSHEGHEWVKVMDSEEEYNDDDDSEAEDRQAEHSEAQGAYYDRGIISVVVPPEVLYLPLNVSEYEQPWLKPLFDSLRQPRSIIYSGVSSLRKFHLSLVAVLRAVRGLSVYGRDYLQSWLELLFHTLHELASIIYLKLPPLLNLQIATRSLGRTRTASSLEVGESRDRGEAKAPPPRDSLKPLFHALRQLLSVMYPEQLRLRSLAVATGLSLETPPSSSELKDFGVRGEDSALATSDRPVELNIETLLSQLPALPAHRSLILNGRGYAQSLLKPLFLALRQMNLQYLELREFNLVEIIPSELGTLTTLRILLVRSWESLLELPECLENLSMLEKLHLIDIPKLCGLPPLRVSPTLRQVYIMECASLRSMPVAFSQVSHLQNGCSTYEAKGCGSVDVVNTASLPQHQLHMIWSDLWKVLECFCVCCGTHCSKEIIYSIECKKMDAVRRKAIEQEEGYVLDSKQAVHLLDECLHSFTTTAGGSNRDPSTGSCPSPSHFFIHHGVLYLTCKKNCARHGSVQVIDLHITGAEKECDGVIGLIVNFLSIRFSFSVPLWVLVLLALCFLFLFAFFIFIIYHFSWRRLWRPSDIPGRYYESIWFSDPAWERS